MTDANPTTPGDASKKPSRQRQIAGGRNGVVERVGCDTKCPACEGPPSREDWYPANSPDLSLEIDRDRPFGYNPH